MDNLLAVNDFLISASDSVEYLAAGRRSSSVPVWLIPVGIAGGVAYRYRDKIKKTCSSSGPPRFVCSAGEQPHTK